MIRWDGLRLYDRTGCLFGVCGGRDRTLRLRTEQRVQERGPWGRSSMFNGAVPLSEVRSHFTILNLTSPEVFGEGTCPGFLMRSVADNFLDFALGTPFGR